MPIRHHPAEPSTVRPSRASQSRVPVSGSTGAAPPSCSPGRRPRPCRWATLPWSSTPAVGCAAGRAFSLDLADRSLAPADLAGLQVRAAGRRLDPAAGPDTGSGPRLRSVRPPASVPVPAVPAAVDPGTPGRYRTVTGEYALRG